MIQAPETADTATITVKWTVATIAWTRILSRASNVKMTPSPSWLKAIAAYGFSSPSQADKLKIGSVTTVGSNVGKQK